MTDVYVAAEVADVLALHGDLGATEFLEQPVVAQLKAQAEILHRAHGAGDRRIAMHVLCWWPRAIGNDLDTVLAMPFSMEDALLTMAREYGFADWERVAALGDTAPDLGFEMAAETMLAGLLAALEAQLAAWPALVHERSVYGHGATLLHYLGANGVESHRQRVPLNAAEIATLLIAHGADKTSTAHMYGGGQTAAALAQTSAHPARAGVAEALVQALG